MSAVFTRPLCLHLTYDTGSRTVVEAVNRECLVLGVHSVERSTCCLRYARADGALTFAEYNTGPHRGTLLRARIVPYHLYRWLRRSHPVAAKCVLDYI